MTSVCWWAHAQRARIWMRECAGYYELLPQAATAAFLSGDGLWAIFHSLHARQAGGLGRIKRARERAIETVARGCFWRWLINTRDDDRSSCLWRRSVGLSVDRSIGRSSSWPDMLSLSILGWEEKHANDHAMRERPEAANQPMSQSSHTRTVWSRSRGSVGWRASACLLLAHMLYVS